jgi:PAS domain-containing protein
MWVQIALSSIGDAVIVTDHEGRVSFINPVARANTVREPLIARDQALRVVTASRFFHEVFKVKPEEHVGPLIYDLGNKQRRVYFT